MAYCRKPLRWKGKQLNPNDFLNYQLQFPDRMLDLRIYVVTLANKIFYSLDAIVIAIGSSSAFSDYNRIIPAIANG